MKVAAGVAYPGVPILIRTAIRNESSKSVECLKVSLRARIVFAAQGRSTNPVEEVVHRYLSLDCSSRDRETTEVVLQREIRRQDTARERLV